MSDERSSHEPTSIEELTQVRDDFALAWSRGERPAVEEYSGRVPLDVRSRLLRELLVLDLFHRTKIGEVPTIEEYEGRFPNDTKIVDEAFSIYHQTETIQASLDSSIGTRSVDGREAPRWLGDYEILGEIARGGMGVVYRARQRSLDRLVALKAILSGELATDEQVRRFHVEAEAAAKLDHPNIVPVYDVGQEAGLHYFSMGLVEGCSLQEETRDEPLPPRRAAELVRTLADAVAYAHERGIVHRDLKPGNVLLDENGTPRITDFGLARRIEADDELTATGQVMGTPSYMPPEQALGETAEVGPSADVYSLGAILYHLLTGRPPFRAASIPETLRQVVDEDPVPPRRLDASIPRDLETICLKCLQKDPSSRYESAAALGADLGRHLAGEVVLARPVGTFGRCWRFCRRNPTLALLAALLVAVTIGGFAAVTWQWLDAESARTFANGRAEYAEQQQGIAEEQRKLAEERRMQADARRLEAAAADRRTRVTLYATEVNLAQRQLEQFDRRRALELLDGSRPRMGEPDLRGFEWYHLWRQVQPDDGTFYLPRNPRAATLSPSGNRMAAVSSDQRIMVYDMNTRRLHAVFDADGQVDELAFSPSGHRLVTVGRGHVAVWDLDARKQLCAVDVPPGEFLQCVAYHPTKPLFATGGRTDFITVRDSASGDEVARFEDMHGYVDALTFGPEDDLYVGDGRSAGNLALKRCDFDSGRIDVVSTDFGDHIECLAYGAQRDVLVAGTMNGHVRIWDRKSGKALHSGDAEVETAQFLHVSDDCDEVLVCGTDPKVSVYSIAEGTVTDRFTDHAWSLRSAHFVSVDGETSHVVSVGHDGTVRFWDRGVADSSQLEDLPSSSALAIDPSGRIGFSSHYRASVWIDPTTGEKIADAQLVDTVQDLAFSPDGDLLATTNGRTVTLWQTASRERLREITIPTETTVNASCARFAMGGRVLLVAIRGPENGRDLGTVFRFDTESWEPLSPLETDLRGINCLAVSPDGSMVVCAGFLTPNIAVHAFDVATGEQKWTTGTSGRSRTNSLGFSRDGRLLAMGCGWTNNATGRLEIREADTGRLVWDAHAHDSQILRVQLLGNGRTVASGAMDGVIKLWNIESGRELLVLRGHGRQVSGLAATADDRVLVSSGRNLKSGGGGTIRFWRASERQEDGILQGHTRDVRGLAFTNDGGFLVSADSVAVRVWDTKDWSLVRTLVEGGWRPFPLGLSPNGGVLAVPGRLESGVEVVRLWDTRTWSPLSTFESPNIHAWAFDPTEPRMLIVSDSDSGESGSSGFVAWNWTTNERRILREETEQPRWMGQLIRLHGDTFAGVERGSTEVGRVRTWTLKEARNSADSGPVWTSDRFAVCAVRSPEGLVLTGGWDPVVKIWSPDGELQATLPGHDGAVHAMAFSPDGRQLATASADRTIRLWDWRARAHVRTLTGHGHGVAAVAFSPDGKRLVSGGRFGELKVWSLDSDFNEQ